MKANKTACFAGTVPTSFFRNPGVSAVCAVLQGLGGRRRSTLSRMQSRRGMWYNVRHGRLQQNRSRLVDKEVTLCLCLWLHAPLSRSLV